MIYREATVSDIDAVLALHSKYQIDSIAEEDKKDGFVTTPFTRQQLSELIERESGLFIALDEADEGPSGVKRVAAYVMAASWQFWSRWPLFAFMIADLPGLNYRGISLSVENSYQYGPVCVDGPFRGSGVLQGIFSYALKAMSARYPVLLTFVNQKNPRSYAAHTRKLELELIKEFEWNGNRYWELGCLTGA